MAKQRPLDTKQCWLCEECGEAHDELKDPPDNCKWCGYRFFSNLFDILKQKTAQA